MAEADDFLRDILSDWEDEYVDGPGGLVLPRPYPATPSFVQLFLAVTYAPLPVSMADFDLWTDSSKELMARTHADHRRIAVAKAHRVVGALRDWRLADRHRGVSELQLAFVAAEPVTNGLGLTPERITEAWDAGYRQLVVARRESLPPHWGEERS